MPRSVFILVCSVESVENDGIDTDYLCKLIIGIKIKLSSTPACPPPGWANFDEMAMDSSSQGPVAMETSTSPWDSAPAAASSTSDNNGAESWAKFDSNEADNKVSGGESEAPFVADFSNLERNLNA